MKKKIIKVNAFLPDVSVIHRAAAFINKGEVVVCPTDTGYAFCVNALNTRAIPRLFALKGRSFDNPIHVAVHSLDAAEEYAYFNEAARYLADHYLPGALTIVLPVSPSVPDIITAGGTTVAVRIPAHLIPLALIEGIGAPLVGTSANVSGKPSPLTSTEVYDQLGDEVDLIIDDGQPCPGTASTIVDVTGEVPVVTREGAIPKEEIEKACQ